MIRVEQLVFEYPGKRALDDVSFSLPERSITALVGPNGAGKTTLLRCIAALEEPFSGSIEVAGINVTERPREVHRKLGYLSDFFGVHGDLTVRQCLIYAARLQKLSEAEEKTRLRDVAKRLELEPYLDKAAGTLSRGWHQRLGIAQALIHNPRLLLLDEPASGLDPEARSMLSSLFRSLAAEGMTLIVSSHILTELEDYCTEMLVLRDGRLVGQAGGNEAAEERLEITFAGEASAFAALWQGRPGVVSGVLEGSIARLHFTGSDADRSALLAHLAASGAPVTGFTRRKTRLQDIYLSLSPDQNGGRP